MTHTDLDPAGAGAASGGAAAPGALPASALTGTTPASAAPLGPAVGEAAGEAGVWTRRLAGVCLLGMLAATCVIVLDAAAGKSSLVPEQPPVAAYLSSIGAILNFKTFLAALVVMTVCFAGAVRTLGALPRRVVIGVTIALNVVVFAGPVLLSQDVFQYVDYGRLGVLHGLNPFLHGPAAVHTDPVFRYVGKVWHFVPTAYGPLFTLLSYPLALLGVTGAVWGMKLLALVSGLAVMALVWDCARRLGRDPLLATVLVAANPLWVIYGMGGAHNDILMDALMMAGVWWVLRGDDARGAAAVVAGAAVKATAIAVLPFMLLARRRSGLLWGTAAALVAIAAVSFAAFGVHGLDFVSVLKRNSTFVSSDSFPNEVAHLLGFPGVFRIDRTLLEIATVIVLAWLLWRCWRGYDWITASAWALLILAVTTTWLLAWYLLWSLPLAVLARDRRVLWATMGVGALFIVHQTAPLFSR